MGWDNEPMGRRMGVGGWANRWDNRPMGRTTGQWVGQQANRWDDGR